ncbi:MAG: sialate O-acetylesterase [Bacteroidales bacterium]|nr:sialate O-acetylesterase [Bacteroidales bacterium]
MKIIQNNFTWILFIFLSVQTYSQVRLPRLISNGMVLQRDVKVKVWGWAGKNESIEINFLDSSYKTLANDNGEWSIILSGLKTGGPYDMKIIASNTLTIKDILIGDVWVCSGQSQMDINMDRVSPLYEEEIRNAGNTNIRYFVVPAVYNFNEPQTDLPYGTWESIGQENILSVSAIAYFFANELYNKYQVPIGIIRSSLGGSPVEAWMSEDAIKQFPEHYQEAQKFKDTALINQIEKSDRKRIGEWYAQMNSKDEGYKNPEMPWYNPEVDISDWSVMKVPGYWADGDLGEVNGVVWYRKDINIPGNLAGKPAKLNLGRIVDADSVFVNGICVGSVSYQYPPRRYKIPENILKKGKNTIVVRLISNAGRGGFVPDKPYELIIEGEKIDLKGEWHYHLGTKMKPMQGQTFVRFKPTGLYNGMIAPLTDYSIKGVIWYQGESNTGRPFEYKTLFPAMINNWREKWQQGDFPFLYVQLHNFMKSYDYPTESNWALTREAQLEALSLPNTAMAVAIDLGEWNDIHPLNKKDVAKRLALAAYKIAYGEKNIVSSGPLYQSMIIKWDSIELSFSNIGSGLTIKDGAVLKHFAIAGEDGKFIWAKAKIADNKVIVWSEKVKKPVAVRYAWADNPEGANLYNKEGLPASPFRTDNWTNK